MKLEKKYKNSFFDKNYFIFLFKNIWKNPFVHIFSVLYFLLILLYSLILPSITKNSPITTFSVPITSLFLVFLVSLIFTFISILIFRVPIDDGTEILIVTKPLSRIEILIVKVSVYILYVIIIGAIGSLLSIFSYIHSFAYYKDNLKIIFGTFIGTLVCGLLFGGFATIISTFFKKTIVMLMSISIVVFFMLYTLLSVFVISNPLKFLSKKGQDLLPISLINYDEKNKSSGLVQGAMSTSGKQPQLLWNEAKQNSNYVQSSMFDFGSQLSSLFTLSAPPSDYSQAIKNIISYNMPIDFVFNDKYDLNKEIKSKFNISLYDTSLIPDDSPFSEIKNILIELEKTNQEFANIKKSISFVGLKKENSSIRSNSKKGIFNQRNYEIGDFTKKNLNEKLWDYFWAKYGQNVSNEVYDQMWYYHESTSKKIIDSKNVSYPDIKKLAEYFKYKHKNGYALEDEKLLDRYNSRSSLEQPGAIFLKNIYIDEVQNNKKSASWFLDTINDLIMSGLYKYSLQKQSSLLYKIFNPLTDFEYNVRLKDIFGRIDITNQDVNKIIKAVEKLLDNKISISGNTFVYEIVNYINENKKDWVNKINEWENERNEVKTFMNLMNLKVQPIVYDYESSITELTSNDPYYIRRTTNISFNLYDSKSIIDNMKIEKYYFSSTYDILPIDILIKNNFNPAIVKNQIDRNILIPIWVIVSLILFVIGSTIYYKKDFA